MCERDRNRSSHESNSQMVSHSDPLSTPTPALSILDSTSIVITSCRGSWAGLRPESDWIYYLVHTRRGCCLPPGPPGVFEVWRQDGRTAGFSFSNRCRPRSQMSVKSYLGIVQVTCSDHIFTAHTNSGPLLPSRCPPKANFKISTSSTSKSKGHCAR